MNNMFRFIFIGFIMLISESNASLDSPDEDLLQTLLDTVMDLNTRIDTIENENTALANQVSNASAAIMELNTELITLREQLEETAIIPPFTGVNFAICSGRPGGISGDPDDSSTWGDLRCPAGSEDRTGDSGEIIGSSANLIATLNNVPSIDECEQECIDDVNGCVAFTWLLINDGMLCGLTRADVPSSPSSANAGIFCALRTEEEMCEIGEIMIWSGLADDLPELYLLADGSVAEDYPDLCEIIAGVCGNPLLCTLPDLMGRFPVGVGSIDSDEVITDLCVEGGETTLILSVE